jgi:acetyl-CoA carboxylase biotin carboxyl carrier protein
VVRIEKGPGEPVGAGEAILILESMKMEMPVESPVDGRVKEIRVKEGQAVAEGDILAVVE